MPKKRRVLGFVVFEACDDYEQSLRLVEGDRLPPGGILDWRGKNGDGAYLFADRNEARAAISRTEHYRLAWSSLSVPERRFCKIVPIVGGER